MVGVEVVLSTLNVDVGDDEDNEMVAPAFRLLNRLCNTAGNVEYIQKLNGVEMIVGALEKNHNVRC